MIKALRELQHRGRCLILRTKVGVLMQSRHGQVVKVEPVSDGDRLYLRITEPFDAVIRVDHAKRGRNNVTITIWADDNLHVERLRSPDCELQTA